MFFGDQPITFLVAHFSKFHDHFFRTKNSKVCWIRPAMTLTSTWESEPPKPWSYDSMKRTMFLRKFFTLRDSTPLTTPSAIITPVSLNWAPGPWGKWQTCTSFFVGIPVCQYPKGYREHEKDDPGNVLGKIPTKIVSGKKWQQKWSLLRIFLPHIVKRNQPISSISRVGHIKIRQEIFFPSENGYLRHTSKPSNPSGDFPNSKSSMAAAVASASRMGGRVTKDRS